MMNEGNITVSDEMNVFTSADDSDLEGGILMKPDARLGIHINAAHILYINATKM